MPATDPRKKQVLANIARFAPLWEKLALQIHAHPELALEEQKASGWLAEALTSVGFAVTRGVADLPTSFIAVKPCQAGGGGKPPVIAYFAEYDALPETGHSCGHNLICTAACLAAQALADIATDHAEIRVIGSPAEESYGGKITMLEKGVLSDIDFAMMAHGGFVNLPNRGMLGRKTITLEFHGHASSCAIAPHLGLNALDALIQTFNAVAMMRHQLRFGAKVSGIITDGGKAPHMIPDFTRAEFLIRTPEPAYLEELQQRLLDCAAGAALATGTTMKHTISDRNYLPMKRNPALEAAYENNLRYTGQDVDTWPADAPIGSTDMANVCHSVPGLHAYFKMVPQEIDHHTSEYALASKSPAGLSGMVNAAKALALTGLDLADDPTLRDAVRKDFHRATNPLPGTRHYKGPASQ